MERLPGYVYAIAGSRISRGLAVLRALEEEAQRATGGEVDA
jgi:hypothetical protein